MTATWSIDTVVVAAAGARLTVSHLVCRMHLRLYPWGATKPDSAVMKETCHEGSCS